MVRAIFKAVIKSSPSATTTAFGPQAGTLSGPIQYPWSSRLIRFGKRSVFTYLSPSWTAARTSASFSSTEVSFKLTHKRIYNQPPPGPRTYYLGKLPHAVFQVHYLDLTIRETHSAFSPTTTTTTILDQCQTRQWIHRMSHLPKMVPHLLLLQSSAPMLHLVPYRATPLTQTPEPTSSFLCLLHPSHKLLPTMAKMAPSTQSA